MSTFFFPFIVRLRQLKPDAHDIANALDTETDKEDGKGQTEYDDEQCKYIKSHKFHAVSSYRGALPDALAWELLHSYFPPRLVIRKAKSIPGFETRNAVVTLSRDRAEETDTETHSKEQAHDAESNR